MTRNDIHKPSLLDPAEYGFVCAFYQGDSPWMARSYQADMEIYEEAIEVEEVFNGNHAAKGTCDHCGAAFNHGVLFMHLPTYELVHIGHICAANTVGLPDKAAAAKKAAEKYAAEMRERERLQQAGAEWREQNAELVAHLATLPDTASNFMKDMQRAIEQWGKLTPRQADAAWNSIERDARIAAAKVEREKALENAPALTAGRQTLTGVIKRTKYQDSDYGTTLKMLVELPDGNRVWGTVPASIDRSNIEGATVNFTATVKPSPEDPHFGFFSRPANARTVEV